MIEQQYHLLEHEIFLMLFYFCMFFWVVYIHIYFICVQCWIKLSINIQKTKIMASGPITSWEIDGETVSDFIFGGSKITADGDCSHEIKRRLLLGRKFITNLDSILKSRDITWPTKVHLVKAMVFQWSCMDARVRLWRKLSAE